jgi:hypothetical protein
MRNFCAAFVATSLMIVPMASAEPLAPGKPAGVRAAQSDDNMPLIFVGLAAIGIGVALAVSSGNDNNGPATTAPTSTTTP